MSNHSLIIDTTEYGRIVFSLDGKSKVYKILPQESDKILIYLDDFLKNQNQTTPIRNPKIIIHKKDRQFYRSADCRGHCPGSKFGLASKKYGW